MARRRRPSRWLTQAALQALVRYGPEESGLRAAAQDAKATYGTTVRQADATSRAIRYEVDRARPTVARNYDEAGLAQARAADVAAPDLAAPGVPASLRAAVAAERSGYTSRLAESRTADLNALSDRRTQAVEGAGYAKINARNTLASTLEKLFTRSQALAGERGAFTVATAQQLKTAADRAAATAENQAAGRKVTMRGQDLTKRGQDLSHQDRVAAQKNGGGRSAGQTRGGATREKLGAAQDEIGRLAGDIGTFKKAGAGRHEVEGLLLSGAKEQRKPIYSAPGVKALNKDGTPKERVIPGVDKAKSALLLKVALDVAYDGYVSKANHTALLRRGLSVRDLGLPSAGEYRRRVARAAPRYKPPNNIHSSPKYGAH